VPSNVWSCQGQPTSWLRDLGKRPPVEIHSPPLPQRRQNPFTLSEHHTNRARARELGLSVEEYLRQRGRLLRGSNPLLQTQPRVFRSADATGAVAGARR
jgi:hypothetical protein